jgi:HK97 gp10 family phage protein
MIVKRAAIHILGNSRKKAPIKTGWLRSDSDVVPASGGQNVEFYADYAGYVELGTYKMYARPFLRTSVETERQNFIESMKRDLIK